MSRQKKSRNDKVTTTRNLLQKRPDFLHGGTFASVLATSARLPNSYLQIKQQFCHVFIIGRVTPTYSPNKFKVRCNNTRSVRRLFLRHDEQKSKINFPEWEPNPSLCGLKTTSSPVRATFSQSHKNKKTTSVLTQ